MQRTSLIERTVGPQETHRERERGSACECVAENRVAKLHKSIRNNPSIKRNEPAEEQRLLGVVNRGSDRMANAYIINAFINLSMANETCRRDESKSIA